MNVNAAHGRDPRMQTVITHHNVANQLAMHGTPMSADELLAALGLDGARLARSARDRLLAILEDLVALERVMVLEGMRWAATAIERHAFCASGLFAGIQALHQATMQLTVQLQLAAATPQLDQKMDHAGRVGDNHAARERRGSVSGYAGGATPEGVH